MVEFFANNPTDQGDYSSARRSTVNGDGTPLRRMDNPHLDGGSANCWSPSVGNARLALPSGVGNHFFYLLSEGSGAKTIGGLPHNSPVCGKAGPVAGHRPGQGVGRSGTGR